MLVDTGVEPMSTAPIEPLVVMMTFEATVGVGVIVPEMVMSACPEYPPGGTLVEMVIADAPKAAKGPRTRKAARMTVAIVLIVFIFDHRVTR